jgi:pimeloyl-ACP methyl ester carboxylesterase
MEFTASDGATIAFEMHGAGRPVVLLHEFPGGLHSWRAQAERLGDVCRVVTPAVRGYAPSSLVIEPKRFTQARLNQDVRELMAFSGAERPVVGGCSMGSYTALFLGLEDPRAFQGLVLVSCGGGGLPDNRAAFEGRIDALAGRYEREDPSDMPTPLDRSLDKRVASLTLRNVIGVRPGLDEMELALRTLDLPVLVIVGENDAACVPGSRRLADLLPNARLEVVPDAGHIPQRDQPDRFEALVRDFLDTLPPC